MAAYVYMLRCKNGSLYTGWTTDVNKRFAAHCAGTGARYTRANPPMAVVYTEQLESRCAAMRREHAIKKLTRAQKEALCAQLTGGRGAIEQEDG